MEDLNDIYFFASVVQYGGFSAAARMIGVEKTRLSRRIAALEKRLGESFKLVSERLELVHQGLGAMQQLASDVGGLQKVLANVKTRGGWGEVQLGALLEQVLTSDQFARNVKTRDDSAENVEFALHLLLWLIHSFSTRLPVHFPLRV